MAIWFLLGHQKVKRLVHFLNSRTTSALLQWIRSFQMTQQLNASLSCPTSFVQSIIRAYLKPRHTRSKLLGQALERFPNTNDRTVDARCHSNSKRSSPPNDSVKMTSRNKPSGQENHPPGRIFFIISYHHCVEFLFFWRCIHSWVWRFGTTRRPTRLSFFSYI